jgi:hypothetical protein
MISRDELSTWLAAVPDYKGFQSLDELNESSQTLADEFPDWVKLKTVGHSSERRPISATYGREGFPNSSIHWGATSK